MKNKLSYFRLDGDLLLDLLKNIPNTITTLPEKAEYFGLLLDDNSIRRARRREVWKGIIKVIINVDPLLGQKINRPDDIPEIMPMLTVKKKLIRTER